MLNLNLKTPALLKPYSRFPGAGIFVLVALAAVSPSKAEAGPISPGPEWKLIFAEEFCCKGPNQPLSAKDGGPSDQSEGGLDLNTWIPRTVNELVFGSNLEPYNAYRDKYAQPLPLKLDVILLARHFDPAFVFSIHVNQLSYLSIISITAMIISISIYSLFVFFVLFALFIIVALLLLPTIPSDRDTPLY